VPRRTNFEAVKQGGDAMTEPFKTQAENAVKALQKWYAADPYAKETGLYHWDDPNFAEDVGGNAAAELVKLYGYNDAFQDTMRWWNNANAITALIDYMLITGDREYLSVVGNTFVKAPNTFTVSINGVEVAAIAGAAEGAAAGAALGAVLAGPLGAVVGGVVGFVAGLFGGGGHAAATTARIYYKDFLNSFYDDEGWWALAWIKAYDLTSDKKYLTAAETICRNMYGSNNSGWDGVCSGGIYWQKNHEGPDNAPSYKNSIANELFLAVSAALYVRLKDETYLKWANDEWTWFQKSGLINNKHLVNDSFGRSSGSSWSCTNDQSTAVWTYNQGVILGGLCELYTATQAKQPQLLDVAEQIAEALIQTPSVEVKPDQSQIGGNTTKSMPFVTARIVDVGGAGPRRRFQIQDWVYFQGTDNKLWRVRNDGSQQAQIGKNSTNSTPFVSSRGEDDWLYFQGTDNKLWRVKHDGSQQSQIGKNSTASMPFVTQHGNDDWVYFRGTDDKLWRVKHDGSQQSQIGKNTTKSAPFVTTHGGEDWVYFQGTNNTLWRVKYDGSQQSQIGKNTTASMPFVMPHGNDDWVYFQGTDNKLWRVKHDGSQQSQIGSNTTSATPHVMSLGSEDWVHFRGTDNRLWRVRYDGWQQTQIGNNTTSSSPFVTAGGWVYFQGTDNRLWKVYLALGPSTSGVNPQGILTEFNDSDPTSSVDNKQFKGVFMRNLGYLYKLRPNARYREFIVNNANSALHCMNGANQFGGDWSQKQPDATDFVRQTAAIDLLNAANAVS
jgi:predicted alpha-1,6-mannanase (GH76 family)